MRTRQHHLIWPLIIAACLLLIPAAEVRYQLTSVGKPVDGYLMFQTNVEARLDDFLENVVDTLRLELRSSRIRFTGLGRDEHQVVFSLSDPADVEQVQALLGGASTGVTIENNATEFSISVDQTGRSALRDESRQKFIYYVQTFLEAEDIADLGIRPHGKTCALVPIEVIRELRKLFIYHYFDSIPSISIHAIDAESDPIQGDLRPGSILVPAENTELDDVAEKHAIRKRVLLSSEDVLDATVVTENHRSTILVRLGLQGRWQMANGRRLATNGREVAMLHRPSRHADQTALAAGAIEWRPPSHVAIAGGFSIEEAKYAASMVQKVHRHARTEVVDFCTE